MPQLHVLLIIEFVFLGVMLAVWWLRRRKDSQYADLHTLAQQPSRKTRTGNRRASKEMRERVRDVPIPWGWPNCSYYRGRKNKLSVSEALYQLSDVLFKEKQLVSEAPADPRIANSFRALIEDRFHAVERNPEAANAGESAGDDVWYVGPVVETRRAAEKKLRQAQGGIRELRKPWGW